jgi:hypothetical protein
MSITSVVGWWSASTWIPEFATQVTRFFSVRGYAVLQSELLWIWVPAFLFAAVVLMLRHWERTEVATD